MAVDRGLIPDVDSSEYRASLKLHLYPDKKRPYRVSYKLLIRRYKDIIDELMPMTVRVKSILDDLLRGRNVLEGTMLTDDQLFDLIQSYYAR
jgi:hypothetical protein